MSTQPSTDNPAEAQGGAPEADVLEEAPETAPEAADGEEEGPQFIEAFGKEAIISIALFIAFVLFAIICLPTYIL
ncbi:hypothetical protein GCM10028820_11580 [Tessaracoccus terricola]